MPAWSLAAPEWIYRFRRVRSVELMDLPDLPAGQRELSLQGLDRIGGWWGQREPLVEALAGLMGGPGRRKLRLVEVGAGSGALAPWIERSLLQRGYRVQVLATDLHPMPGVKRLDALKKNLPEADIYFSNLFLHHLPDASLPILFKAQARASRLGFVHFDVQRHWAHFYGAALRIQLAGLPAINFTDALRSIQQGYTRQELQALAAQGAPGARLRWVLPCRWMLTWKRP
jgi:hypothetical protein